jgi:hypothetical protein
MAQREYELGLLARLRPDDAAEKILKAYRAGKGHNPDAALHLGIGVRTLERWVTRLGIRERVDAIRTRAGHRISKKPKKDIAPT